VGENIKKPKFYTYLLGLIQLSFIKSGMSERKRLNHPKMKPKTIKPSMNSIS